MITVILMNSRFNNLSDKYHFQGCLFRWLTGLGRGSFSTSAYDLVITELSIDSNALLVLKQILSTFGVDYLLKTVDKGVFSVLSPA